MKKNRSATISLYLLPAAILSAVLFHVHLAHAQVPETPEQAANSRFSPYEQAWRRAQVVCRLQFHQNNIPDDQRSSFMTACMQAEGLVDPPPGTQSANPTTNAGTQ